MAGTGADVKLLTFFPSPFGMRVAVALRLKGITHETLEVNLMGKPQILIDSNPVHKKIPVLIHNGKPVCESLVIVEYIDETWPSTDGHDLLPKDPYERAVARFWADFTDKQVFGAAIRMITGFGEGFDKAKQELAKSFETMEWALKDMKGPFFGGEFINIADVALAPILSTKDAYEAVGKMNLDDAHKFPKLYKWMEAVNASSMASVLSDPAAVKQFVLTLHNAMCPTSHSPDTITKNLNNLISLSMDPI